MGVRLVRYSHPVSSSTNNNIAQNFDHSELINRDLLNQHPIYAITGLQEELNLLEDSIYNLSLIANGKDEDVYEKIKNNLDAIKDLEKRIEDLENTINNDIKDTVEKLRSMQYLDTNTIELVHDPDTPSLKGNVKVWKPEEGKENTNTLQSLTEGLYVPKLIFKDSETVTWGEEVKGESLSEIFNEGSRFSHTPGTWNDHCYPSEETSWYWDEELQSFVQPWNTGYFNGFVTKKVYDYYTHLCTIKSRDSDDDADGIVIGYVTDELGNSHTLTAMCDRGGYGGNLLAIWYNYDHPNSQRVAYKIIGSSGAWSSAPDGIVFEIKKNENHVSVCSSRYSGTEVDESMRIDIDLNDYEWGSLFSGPVKYGYCNISQASTFYQDVHFTSSYIASTVEVIANIKISKDENNSVFMREDGLYAEGLAVSEKEHNAIVREEDGYYVRDSSSMRMVSQDNHGFAVGDFIYYHPTLKYQKAKAIDSFDSNIVGMVINVIDENNFEFQWAGFFETDLFIEPNGFVQGMPVYISETEAGKTTQEQPDISKTVGYPVENNGIIISIERGVQYNQESTIGDFKTSANTYNIRSDGFILVTENADYKLSLIHKLIETLNDEFKDMYMIIDEENDICRFKNTEDLYSKQAVTEGMNLFIKAF